MITCFREKKTNSPWSENDQLNDILEIWIYTPRSILTKK